MRLIMLLALTIAASFARAETVTLIGDSHTVGFFGNALIKQLQMSGKYHVEREAVVGYSAQSWSQRFSKLQSKISKSSVVIVALGTNDAVMTRCNSTKTIEKLATQVHPNDQKCFWVGPPNFTGGAVLKACGSVTKYNSFVDKVKKAVTAKGCEFVDSRQIKSNGRALAPNAGDRTHFQAGLGKDWGTQVGRRLLPRMNSSSTSSNGTTGGVQ